MKNLDTIIFGKKKLSSLFKEIYDNQTQTKTQISGLIQELKPLIKHIGDATLIVPLLKEYLDMGIKNDDHLIKMVTIIQRLLNTQGGEGNGIGISDAEKSQLMEDIENLQKDKK